MRKCILLALHILLIFSLITIPVFAEGQQQSVTVKIVMDEENYGEYSSVAVTVVEYLTAECRPEDELREVCFTVSKSQGWTRTIMMDTGYYKIVSASVVNTWKEGFIGNSDEFTVDDDAVTVYLVVKCGSDPDFETPVQKIVYGEDTQEFGIWAPEEEEPETEDTEETEIGESVPQANEELEEAKTKEKEQSVIIEQPEPEIVEDGSTGDIITRIVRVILGIIALGCVITLVVLKKQRS